MPARIPKRCGPLSSFHSGWHLPSGAGHFSKHIEHREHFLGAVMEDLTGRKVTHLGHFCHRFLMSEHPRQVLIIKSPVELEARMPVD
jgi:hypothetical protein